MKTSMSRYIIALVLIAFSLLILLQDNYTSLLSKVTLLDIVIAMLISSGLAFSRGYITHILTKKQFEKNISWGDWVLLPLMMRFWGFLIPINGGTLFMLFFLKSKYKIRIVEGTSMTLYMHLVMMVITGLFGLTYSIYIGRYFTLISAISAILLFAPIILKIINQYLQSVNLTNHRTFIKLQNIIDQIIKQSHSSWLNFQTNLAIITLSIIRVILRVVSHWWAAYILNIDVPLTSLIILTFLIELTMMSVKFIPGNLGVNELLSGGVIGVLGATAQEGILIALIIRVASLLLTFTVGLGGILFNMKYFHLHTIRDIWHKIKTA